MRCNICGNDIFVDMNSRKNIRCNKCNSLERTRLLWMYIQSLKIGRNQKILHLAPEKGLSEALSKIVDKGNYVAADIKPEMYPFVDECLEIDLCDLENQTSFEYDFIIHIHVLEHTPCNVAYTLFHLHRMLKKDGRHLCVIPFTNGKYDESFQELSNEERQKRFGQFDHVRSFGNEDIYSHLGKVINMPSDFDAAKDFEAQDLIAANIPRHYWSGFQANTVLNFKRNDMKFISKETWG